MSYKETLKRLMAEQGLSIRQLAKAANVSESNLKTWLGGGEPKKLDEVRRVAHALDVTFEFLIFGEDTTTIERVTSQFWEDIYSGVIRVKIERLKPNK